MIESLSKFKLLVIAAAEKGFLMVFACVIAIIFANFTHDAYEGFIHNEHIGFISVHYVTNEFLMAIFFLLVGMEIKRELITGHLSTLSQALMPLVAAIGGMIGPLLIYLAINHNIDQNVVGWAIPTATDIAFTLTILSIFGKGIPSSVRVFLTALAIIDDLLAIVIIAIYYTSTISVYYISACVIVTLALLIMNRTNVKNTTLYLILGVVLWYCFLKSGVHATISGVILAFCIPLKVNNFSPIEKIEKLIHKPVLYLILPLFAFVNSGVNLSGISYESFTHPITLGIALGLFFGKQVGVFTTCLVGVKSGMLKIPAKATWIDIYGASILCGIGFTMSLFVGMLSFNDESALNAMKLGVFSGSLLSIAYGAIILNIAHRIRK